MKTSILSCISWLQWTVWIWSYKFFNHQEIVSVTPHKMMNFPVFTLSWASSFSWVQTWQWYQSWKTFGLSKGHEYNKTQLEKTVYALQCGKAFIHF